MPGAPRENGHLTLALCSCLLFHGGMNGGQHPGTDDAQTQQARREDAALDGTLAPPDGTFAIAPQEPKWQRVTSFVVVLFYMSLVGLLLGKTLLAVWPRGGPDDVPVLAADAAKFSLASKPNNGDKYTFIATIAPPYSHIEHGEKLTGHYLRDMGMAAEKFELVELAVTNLDDSKSTLRLSESAGMAELVDETGRVHRNLPLPRESRDRITAFRLAQRRPGGELAPGQTRQFWLMFEKPLDFSKLKSGKLTFASGEALDLEVAAR